MADDLPPFSKSEYSCDCNNLLPGKHITTLGSFCKNNRHEREGWLQRAYKLKPRQARWILFEPNPVTVKPNNDVCKGVAGEDKFPVIKWPTSEDVELIVGLKKVHSDEKCTVHNPCMCKTNFVICFIWGRLFTGEETRYFYNILRRLKTEANPTPHKNTERADCQHIPNGQSFTTGSRC